MRTVVIAGLLGLLLASAGCADVTFTLKDYLHHDWHNEFVSYLVDPGQVPHPAILTGPGGEEVPVQITPRGKQTEVAFIVASLAADDSVKYVLSKGQSKAGQAAGKPMVYKTGDHDMVLDGGTVAADVMPAPLESITKPEDDARLHNCLAPLMSVKTRDGKWLGAGSLVGDLPVKSVKTTLVASGPVYAETRADFVLEGGRYSMTVRVVTGQAAVQVSEEFDMPAAAAENCFFQYDLKSGFDPQRLAVLGRLWRKRTDSHPCWADASRSQATGWGQDYKLDFDADRRECQCLGYVCWWPETVRLLTLHASATGQTVSFFPTRIGAWRNPMGSYLETRKDGSLYLSLPLYVKQTWPNDGVSPESPYYTGRLEPGWPQTALRRSWAFFLAPEEEAFPPAGRSSIAEAVVKYSDLPLDKIKDWTFSWNWEGVKYPRLYVDPDKLEQIRARARTIPGWDQGLFNYPSRPLTYVLTGDPKVGDQLLHAPATSGAAGCLPEFRHFVSNLLDNWGYVGWPSPNNAAPLNELVMFDAAMSVTTATPAEKAEMQQGAAFIAQMIYDPDWHAWGAGWHLGNPNMPPRQEDGLAVASRVLPTHPLAPQWAARGAAEQKYLLDTMVKPSGAWRECPHYQYDAALYPMMLAAVPLKLQGTYDVFADPRLKSTLTYLMNILTPPDPRFRAGTQKLRVLPAFGNGSWEFMPTTGWIAALSAHDDPDFSRQMMWAWQAQGGQSWWEMSPLVLNPSLPAKQPDLKSALFAGFGAVLRSGFPSDDETWIAFRHGNCIEHYDYGDEGSFMLYAKGAPLVLHFGSQYTPYYSGSWSFNEACVNHRPLAPADGAAYQVIQSFGLDPANYCLGTGGWEDLDSGNYVMDNRGFFAGKLADYARGEQVQKEQGVVGKDPTQPLPPNTAVPTVAIPETHWNRRLALLKDPDPLGPNYLVMRDDFTGAGSFPAEWNIWTLAQDLQTNANQAVVTTKYGVTMDVYMADPAQPNWTTHPLTALPSPTAKTSFIASPSGGYVVDKPWIETLTNLRATQAPGQGFLAVLYPRKSDQPAAQYQTLAAGKGVRVTTEKGTDWIFLSEVPVQWTGEGLSFSGTAGAIRKVGEKWTVEFFEPGSATVNGKPITADQPQEVAL